MRRNKPKQSWQEAKLAGIQKETPTYDRPLPPPERKGKRGKLKLPENLSERLHGAVDPHCEVCTHEFSDMIEQNYNAWMPAEELEKLSNIPSARIKRHMDALGLTIERSKNTEALISMGIEKAVAAGVLDKLDADQVLSLIKEKNRLEGKIIERRRDEGPRTVLLVGFPAPGGILPQPEARVALQGAQTLLGPPTFEAEVVEEVPAKGAKE